MFFQSITIDISDSICGNECINSNRLKRCEVQVNKVTDLSISTTFLIDNLTVFPSKYPLLELSSVDNSDVKKNPLYMIKLKNIRKEVTSFLEDNDIERDIVCWGGVFVDFFKLKYLLPVIHDMIGLNRI